MVSKKIWIAILIIVFVAFGLWYVLSRAGLEPGGKEGLPLPEATETSESDLYIEVFGPAGNEYADPEYYKSTPSLPVEELPQVVARLLKNIVPNFSPIRISKETQKEETVWTIRVVDKKERRYDLEVTSQGRIEKMSSLIDEKSEAIGKIFTEGNIQEIPLPQVPENVLARINSLSIQEERTKAYAVDALEGFRYFIRYGDNSKGTIVSLTEEGEIRSAGRASFMLAPYIPPKIETLDEITANLSQYGNKYHVDQMIKRIQQVEFDKTRGFRFVVMGDSRSNLKMWRTIVSSINKWRPIFVINVGDLTRYGYSGEMNKYLFTTLEERAAYPFLPVVGNHDVRRGYLAYTYAFGGDNARVYFFDYGHCRFIILDSCEYKGRMPWEEQLAQADKWLAEKENFHKFVFMHHPITDVKKWSYHSMPPEMSAPLTRLMSKHKVDQVFFGHIHSHSTASYEGVNYMITGGGGASLHDHYGDLGSHHHYIVVDVLPNKTEKRLVRFLPKNN